MKGVSRITKNETRTEVLRAEDQPSGARRLTPLSDNVAAGLVFEFLSCCGPISVIFE